ncbi:MAG: hypothetical protein E5X34_27340 [Mesorhizobium sp.]|uniref:hypothetical protein n=1 Tax=Mesorhizobium sp. TaxID=1871066 RepID=UPI00120FE090|nr:hypothetical protein [Mesorhizobium sp.]TIR15891.1 MAG: hypothetical protein E5X34_27340 [Mesorhizobium sp.]
MSEGEAMAPVGSQLSTAQVEGTSSSSNEDISPTQLRMNSLVQQLTDCEAAARKTDVPEEAVELISGVVDAASAILEYRASLPAAEAQTIMPDDKVRRCCQIVCDAANEVDKLGLSTITKLDKKTKKAAGMVDKLYSYSQADRQELLILNVENHHTAAIKWWEKKAWRSERQRSACAATASLSSGTPVMREAERCALRLRAGSVLSVRIWLVRERIGLARAKIELRASRFEPDLKELLVGRNGVVQLMASAAQEALRALSLAKGIMDDGKTLNAHDCAVVEKIMERLSDFGLALHEVHTKLSHTYPDAGLPLKLFERIVDDAWITAHDAMHLLNLQSPPWRHRPRRALRCRPGQALRYRLTLLVRLQCQKALQREGKGSQSISRQLAPGLSAAGQPSTPVAANAGTVPAAKVLARSDQVASTQVRAQEVAASSSGAGSTIGGAALSMEVLTERLKRLDELLQFDLAGQQSVVSQVRQMKPEEAGKVVDDVAQYLRAQAIEMQTCLAGLQGRNVRLLLTSTQLPKVHERTDQLKGLLNMVLGQANALNEGKAGITTDCMKTYAFPAQKYLEHLCNADELMPPEAPVALRGEPGKLFEMKLQPKMLVNGAMPSPMWVHIHTSRPVMARNLEGLADSEFTACHVKSNEQRGYNREREEADARSGREKVIIHRGKLTPAFCKSLLTSGLGRQPRHSRAELPSAQAA